VERVRQLLALGASVTAQDEQGRTALVAAAYQNNLSVTDLLIPACTVLWCIIVLIGRVLARYCQVHAKGLFFLTFLIHFSSLHESCIICIAGSVDGQTYVRILQKRSVKRTV
jgi:Ankyrin repeats (many copies)